MLKMICTSVLLGGAMMAMSAAAQQPASPQPATPAWMKNIHATGGDVGVTVSLERARTTGNSGSWFWLKGGSADGSLTFYRRLGLAANFTGESASNIQNGVGLSKIAFMAGPRYTFNATPKAFKGHSAIVFGEALFGGVHAFNSVFPATGAPATTSGSFSAQIGGGIDIGLAKGFNLRSLELDWVHTALPDNASNKQNDFRVAFGMSYRR